LGALEARMADEEARPIAQAARRRGGRRLDDGLGVDPAFRAAVDAALGELARAYVVPRESAGALADQRGVLLVERPTRRSPTDGNAAVRTRAAELGGGLLAGVVRRDPTGAGGELLATACWVPDLPALLELQLVLPPGWVAVVRDGSVSAGPLTLTLGRAADALEARAELDRLGAAAEAAERVAAEREAEARTAATDAAAARRAFEENRVAEGRAIAARRGRLTADRAKGDRARRDAEGVRARAEAAAAMDAERVTRAENERAAMVERERAAQQEMADVSEAVAEAVAHEAGARMAIVALESADAVDRRRLAETETLAAGARSRLRLAEVRLRAAEVAEPESRLA